MKNEFLKCCLFASICGTTCLSLVGFSSCQKQNNGAIYLSSKKYVVNERQFNFPAYFNLEVVGEVSVELQNNNHLIKLVNNTGVVRKGALNLFFEIDESVLDNSSFWFDIKFTFTSSDNEKHTVCIYDVLVEFKHEEPQTKDVVWLDNYLVSALNSHQFIFKVLLSVKPISNVVDVSIKNQSSSKFSLSTPQCEVQTDESIPYINVQIDLDMDITQKSNYSFDLHTSFINSFGLLQNDTFEDCVISYDRQVDEDVPDDYLNLEAIDEYQRTYILHGLKPGIPEVEAGKYKRLIIPKNVVSIDENAFNTTENADWLRGVKFLKIPYSVKNIGQSAFVGLKNILQLDLLDYKNQEIPNWYTADQNLFETSTIQFEYGYIWLPNNFNKKDRGYWGLPNLWTAYIENDVVGEEFYQLNSDKTVITGLQASKLNQLKDRKIIKFPDSVIKVDPNSFGKLRNYPYYNKTLERYETRRVVFSSHFETAPEDMFALSGVSGPIYISSSKIGNIPSKAFQFADQYDWPALENVYAEDTKLFFAGCNELTKIDDNAFHHMKLVGNLILPPSISTIGDYAFMDCYLNKIVFNDRCTSVGLWAFAGTDYYPTPKSLTVIDCSQYTTIKNPGEPNPTYQPDWFNTDTHAFEGVCADSGKIIINQKIYDEIKNDEEKWLTDFKAYHNIPAGWQLEVI